jgi:hypothetical protein
MDEVVYWEVFENTGLIEAYLTYCRTEGLPSDSHETPEELKTKGFEGEE